MSVLVSDEEITVVQMQHVQIHMSDLHVLVMLRIHEMVSAVQTEPIAIQPISHSHETLSMKRIQYERLYDH